MNNYTDYYSTMLARKLFQQEQQQREEERLSHTPLSVEDIIPEQDMQADPFEYAIFHNPGCGYIDGQELKGQDERFQQRWLAFYQATPEHLPQHRNLLYLHERRKELMQDRGELFSPRLALSVVGMLLLILVYFSPVMPGLIALIGIGLPAWIWVKTADAVEENTRHLHRNQEWIKEQTALLAVLQDKVNSLKSTLDAGDLQRDYTWAVERFVADSVQEFFPSLDEQELEQHIQQGEVQLFVVESRGVLQIPGVCQHSIDNLATLESLLHKVGKGLCAVQPFAELEGLTRLHYLYGILCFEQGILFISGYYDWVDNRIHGVQRDFYSYRNLSHIQHIETAFPEDNQLRAELPDEIWQQHFGEPVQVIALGIKPDGQHCCTLPRTPLYRRTWLSAMPGTRYARYIKRDVRQLIATLTGKLHRQRAPESVA